MNIRFLKREELNAVQWDTFIRGSSQYRLYARSIWLDAFSPGWAALIDSDYSVVMPLTLQKKYGIVYLAQPRFTQQLGFYSSVPVTAAVKHTYIEKAKELFPFAEINLNDTVPGLPSIPKTNYILPLNQDYPSIKASYSRNLINNSLKPALKQQFTYCKKSEIRKAITAYRQLYQQKMKLHRNHYLQLLHVAETLADTGDSFTRQVKNAGGDLLAISLFFQDEKRIYNICSATTAAGRRTNANHFLYDQLIQEFAASGLILDFEGSSIAGIAAFYRKFGAVPENYYFLKWNHLKWPYTIFKK